MDWRDSGCRYRRPSARDPLDNITHTLVGVLVGEAFAQRSPQRGALLTLMAVGSNLPDADLLYSSLSGNKLDYLLEHRGYTHTVVGALAVGVLSYLVCMLVLRRRHIEASSADRRALLAAALFAPLLHLAMDATNSYGVHPFWPFDDRWFYGDAVFIVEPLIWASCAPLVFVLRSLLARILVTLVLLGGVLLSVGSGLVRAPNTALLCLLTLALLGLGYRAPARTAVAAGIAIWLAVTAVFLAAGHLAARRVDTLAARTFPQGTMIDHALTPMAEDPLCWELILMQLEGGAFTLREATLSLAPASVPATSCRRRRIGQATLAPLVPVVGAASSPAITWQGQVSFAPTVLASLAARNCAAAALLRFARAPWVSPRGPRWLMGDLRFGGGSPGRLGMAELELPGRDACPRHVPPWRPPREDILGSAAAEVAPP